MNELAQLWGGLPVVAAVALFRRRCARGRSFAEAWLETAVLYGAAVWVGANFLSAFDGLRPWPLRIAWGVIGVWALVSLWRTRRVDVKWPRPCTAGEWSLVGLGAGLLGLTLLRALLAAPATMDVLSYHLPRQLMWLQQGSLAPFVTVNDRQNMMPPLAEVLGLQFLGLTGDDRWVNLPQWLAYAGVAIGLATLTRRLGASRGAALLAAVLGLLLPMAYHESSNAKNDLLAAFWLLVGAVQLVRWREPGFSPTRTDAMWLAGPFALAWLTKSTAMLFAPPLLIVGLWPWLRARAARESARVLAPAGLVALLLIAPFHLRNLEWYGTPLGVHRAEDGGAQGAAAYGPRLLASSALRQASLHLISPWSGWNKAWLNCVRRAHEWLGVDPQDRRTTLWMLSFDATYAPEDETLAGAPAHFVIGVPLLLALALGGWPGRTARSARWLAIATTAGALLFCILLKWQPWAARLELPLFLLGIGAVVVAWAGVLSSGRGVAAASLVGLGFLAWLPGAETAQRPLWTKPALWNSTREADYYRQRPREQERDVGLEDLIVRSGARHLLIQSVHDIPYPLMRRLQLRVPELRFAGAPADEAQVDAIAVLSLGAVLPLRMQYADRTDWRLVGVGLGDGVYLPEAQVQKLNWWTRLPDFGGWARQMGLPWSEWEQPGVGRFSTREMPSGRGALAYEGTGRTMCLRGTVCRLGNPLTDLHLIVRNSNGSETVVSCGQMGRADFEVKLPATVGPQGLDLRVDDVARGTFVFTRLQVYDLP